MGASRDERRAVALRYDPADEHAPRLLAKGRAEIAERLIAVAEEHGVPIRRDPDLAQLLSVTELGDEIPEDLYGAVAELIGFLWRLNGEMDE